MMTFDFAYWLDDLDPKSRPDQPPSDRFPLQAPSILHGMNEGVRQATEKLIRGSAEDEKLPRIVKVEILQL